MPVSGFKTVAAVLLLMPAEQPVNQLDSRSPRPMISVLPAAAADGDVRSAAEQHVDKLVQPYQQIEKVKFHHVTANTSSGVVAVVIASSSACRLPMIDPDTAAYAAALADTLAANSVTDNPR